jgi:hypothetical protein
MAICKPAELDIESDPDVATKVRSQNVLAIAGPAAAAYAKTEFTVGPVLSSKADTVSTDVSVPSDPSA